MKSTMKSTMKSSIKALIAIALLSVSINVQAAPSPSTGTTQPTSPSPTTETTKPISQSTGATANSIQKTQEAIVHKLIPVAETYKDYNYALVYNYEFYRAIHPDLVAAFGDNKIAYIRHFITYGMAEGRQACAQFNVNYYKETYADLQSAFGSDLTSYYLHFVNNGYNEGRIGAVTNYVPKQDNFTEKSSSLFAQSGKRTKVSAKQDVSKVYNYEFYRQNNPDLQIAFGDTVSAYRKHFIEYGMAEGRQGTPEFNLAVYRNYEDLINAFGDDYVSYYLHYINNGIKEGRISK